MDFNEDISVIRDVAKPLLLEALGNNGLMINEFHDWNVQVSEKEVRLTGVLEDGGTRRLLSFLDTPPSLQLAEDQPAAEETPESLVRVRANSTSTRLDRCWGTCETTNGIARRWVRSASFSATTPGGLTACRF